MEAYSLTGNDLLIAAMGICLLAWCSLVVYSASRSDKLRQQRSMTSLRLSLEDILRNLHVRRKARQPTAR